MVTVSYPYSDTKMLDPLAMDQVMGLEEEGDTGVLISEGGLGKSIFQESGVVIIRLSWSKIPNQW